MTAFPKRMTDAPEPQGPAVYRLRVAGLLDHHWSPWFGDLTLTQEDVGTTSLSGSVSDQAVLHGLLAKVRDLGITLISVELIAPDTRGRIGSGEASSQISRLVSGQTPNQDRTAGPSGGR